MEQQPVEAEVVWSDRRAARSSHSSGEQLQRFLSHDDPHVVVGALANPRSPVDSRQRKLRSLGISREWDIGTAEGDAGEAEWMMAHASSNDPARQRLAAMSADPAVAHRLVVNPDLDSGVAAALLTHPDWTARRRLVRAEFVDHLVADPHPLVRKAVTLLPDLLPALATRLASDPDGRVRRSIASRPDVNAAALALLADDPDAGVRQCVAWATPVLTHDVAVRLASDANTRVRILLARRRQLPVEVVGELALDQSPVVAGVAVSNPIINQAQLLRAVEGAAAAAAAAAWRRLETRPPISSLRHEVQIALAFDGLGADDVYVLAHAADATVRAATARGLAASPQLLDRLASDPDTLVRRRAAANPNTPPNALQRLLDDQDAECRREASRHPSVPLVALEQLAVAGADSVRRAAYEHPQQTTSGRRSLALALAISLPHDLPGTVRELARSEDPVALAAACRLGGAPDVIANQSASPYALREAWQYSPERTLVARSMPPIVQSLARHTSLPDDLALELLATYPQVAQAIAARSDLDLGAVRAIQSLGDSAADYQLIKNRAAWSNHLPPPLRLGDVGDSDVLDEFASRSQLPRVTTYRIDSVLSTIRGGSVQVWSDLEGRDAGHWSHLAVGFGSRGQVTGALALTSGHQPNLVTFGEVTPRTLGTFAELKPLNVFTGAAQGWLAAGQVSVDFELGSRRPFGQDLRLFHFVAASFGATHGAPFVATNGRTNYVGPAARSNPACVVHAFRVERLDGSGAIAYLLEGLAHAFQTVHDNSVVLYVSAEVAPRSWVTRSRSLLDLALETAQMLADQTAMSDRPR